jgi:hypothetical protein
MIKYLFITLDVQDGERKHTHRILHSTPGENIEFAAQRYVASFWGYGERLNKEDDYFWVGGEITLRLSNVVELTEYEYKLMSRIFSGDKKRNDYFEIVQKGYEAGLEREEVEINLGENGKLMLYKTPEGSIVDVYNQDEEVNTMTIWEDDLSPLEVEITVKTHGEKIQEFLNTQGQKHSAITAELGLHPAHNMSDEILMDDYFFLEKKKQWYPKNSSMYGNTEQAIANFLRENRDDY